MKKIKLDHDLAQAVLKGDKTSTWRLYDDKNLTVNDRIVLIDKVDPQQAQTWQAIGSGRINKVVEKRVGDITPDDYEGHNPYDSQEALLADLRKHYGERVTRDTPVKMIHFDFTAGQPDNTSHETDDVTLIGEHVTLYADGGSRGNPGPSACGYILLDEQGEVLVDKGVYLGITTNNQAEYQGLKSGLEEALQMGARSVDVRLDSMLVINQMKGVFKVKNRDLWPIHDNLKQLVKSFDKVSFTHVPREMNRLADAAVNRVLDEVKANNQLKALSD